jgi:acid phosphatase family membrane protein YuiD
MWTALLAWFIAQSLKVLFVYIGHKRLDLSRFVGAGGMPSSHSAMVSSTAMMMGLTQGFDSPLFALCIVLCCVVTYDASGVRKAAGQQAKLLNRLREKWDPDGEMLEKPLNEMLGHTHLQVAAGIVLGISIALLMYFLFAK